ncbi:hypothetical protein ASG29_08395 [Sphingomonas sp. Leaf412]|uniref:alpha/beta fold hydrolase n=1 Tax=Sphingomonas sp. Leaf412 TaxID=1736370 RepID=UPI0006FA5CB6|nr:alpha/beta hydrolase [Sphingomonas sp. Leaf412]KQT31894.1 hypothetical protein ASG29_08395 [Sphingomonas sp. Leaf412]
MIREAALAALALLQTTPPAPDTRVAVDGTRRINLVCTGQGSPTVVLTGGAGATAATWRAVQPAVAARTRTCSWDRAGFGRSDAGPARQTATETARDLDRALAAAKVTGPLVLVGHSIGSYETLLFADAHPRRVAGIVLADPSLPDMFRLLGEDPAAVMAPHAAPFRACAAALRAGTPPPAGPVACAGDPARYDTAVSFFDAAGDSARAVANPRRSFGAMPLVVLTVGPAPAAPTPWTAGHDSIAALSTRGTRAHVPDSGHMIQRDRPAAIVAAIATVLDMLSLSRHTTTR